MKTEKLDGPWPPIIDPTIWVENRLPDKRVYVMIVPNEDYV